MERGVSRGKREVCPSDQATRKGLGNLLDSLACLGESRGDSPPASLADNDLPSFYGSPGASWQDKPRRGGVRWITKNPSYISCMEGDKIAQRKRHAQIRGHAAFLLHTLYRVYRVWLTCAISIIVFALFFSSDCPVIFADF
jgi:hypothetical protein